MIPIPETMSVRRALALRDALMITDPMGEAIEFGSVEHNAAVVREIERDTRPEVVPGGHPDGWDEYLTTLPSVSGTITIEAPPDVASAPILRDPTPQSREESAGDTGRRELAEGKCQRSWTDMPKRYVHPHSEDVYRGHRCGREAGHRGVDRCRYCEQERTGMAP